MPRRGPRHCGRTTVRALKFHGGRSAGELEKPDPAAVERGLANLEKHVENIRHFGEIPIVALNRFDSDGDEELAVVRSRCEALGVPFAVSDHFARGGEGAIELARAVIAHAKTDDPFRPLYELDLSLPEKILAVAQKMYGASGVVYTQRAQRQIDELTRPGYGNLPVCIGKTPGSLSDDPKRHGAPSEFELTVRSIEINAGAGFIVVLTVDILRMPGLPRRPLAERIGLIDGKIVGLE
jgi:formate--tetrahydrofolate ligase